MPAVTAIAAAGSSRKPRENQTAAKEDEFMPEFLDLVKTRRSIRKYEGRDVPAEALAAILEAVRWAPSWADTPVLGNRGRTAPGRHGRHLLSRMRS